jgi:predicted  nucleic acid-binding Zn-ribbon protein
MSVTKTTISSFVKQFIATVKGDDVTAQAEKVFRQATSALNTQISSLEGDLIGLEDSLSDAKEALVLKRVNNGNSISDRNSYVSSLFTAKNSVTSAEEALDKHKAKITFLKEELKALTTQVEA